MITLLIGSAVLLLLVLVCVLATGSVVARLAVHMRDESWARISSQQSGLRRREQEFFSGHTHDMCDLCSEREV
jgi:hypothetical protein